MYPPPTIIAVVWSRSLPRPPYIICLTDKKHSTMPYTLFLAAFCLTLLTVDAEQVVQTAEVDIAANAHHTFTFETPLTATLLKSVSLVNVAQQGSCANDTVQVSLAVADAVYNKKIGFNNSEWVQFVGTNTSSSVTADVTVLNCASRLKAVAVFYYVDPTPLVLFSEPKVVSGSDGDGMDVTVPLDSSYVGSVTLRLLDLAGCDNKSYEVLFVSAYTSTMLNDTFAQVGDRLTFEYDHLFQLPSYESKIEVLTWVLTEFPASCAANFVVELDCYHVDIPISVAPPTSAPYTLTPTTPYPASTSTYAPYGGSADFDWQVFLIVMGTGGVVFLVVVGAIIWKYGFHAKMSFGKGTA